VEKLWERVGSILGEMAKPRTIAELEKKMTPKQVKLARALAAGGIPKVQAYRQVYGWNGTSKNALQVKATEACNNGKVAVLATELRERETARLWQNKSRFQDWLMSGITDTITSAESDVTRLKALELAGRTRYASLFEEPQANETTATLSGAIADTIRAKLQAMLSGESAPGESSPGALMLEGVVEDPTGGGEGDEGE
jgi:hypothetical protein